MTSSFAQKIRFTDSSNRWVGVHVTVADPPPAVVTAFNVGYGGDSIINGKSYRALATAYVREDTILNTVFIIPYDSAQEEVLMNYNWHLGDSVIHNIGYDSFRHIITDIDSTQISGIWYKVWQLTNILGPHNPSDPYKIIEGIGALGGPLYAMFPYTFETYDMLYCFSNDNLSPQVSPSVDYFDNTTSCHLSLNEVLTQVGSTYIFPNPGDEKSKVVFPYTINSGNLYIFNSIGQIVRNIPLYNKQAQAIGKLPGDGLYFYRLIDKKIGTAFTGKFIYK